MRLWLIILAVLLSVQLPCYAKSDKHQLKKKKSVRVLLVRHGEKTPKNALPTGDIWPNAIGIMHAWALVPYLQTYAPQIDAIYAAPQGIDGEHSYRPMEICGNIAQAQNIPINGLEKGNLIAVDQVDQLVANIKANLQDGQTALICWEHNNIPRIAKALGVKKLPDWKSFDFSHVWDIRINGDQVSFSHTHEKLPNQFRIPNSAFHEAPISVLKSQYPLQYQQLTHFCPSNPQKASEHLCSIDWISQVHCCDHLIYTKDHANAKGCSVSLDQCSTWYGITGWKK